MSFFLPSILFRYRYDQEMAVPTSWQEGRNSILTTVSRKTAHRRISFLIIAVSAPERHWIGFQCHFARAAHATYSVGTVRSSGRTHNIYNYYIYYGEFHVIGSEKRVNMSRSLLTLSSHRTAGKGSQGTRKKIATRLEFSGSLWWNIEIYSTGLFN